MGHFGGQQTSDYICRWYWWPKVNSHVEEFCKTCDICQQAKNSNKKPTGVLHPLPIPSKPWESIGMDFIGPFPESQGYNYLWVIVCRLTSRVHVVPIKTMCNNRGVKRHNICLSNLFSNYKLLIYVTCIISFFFHFEYLDNIVQ